MNVDPVHLADALWQARVNRNPIVPLTTSCPGITLEEAYAISRLNFERRLKSTGVKSIGRKIGLTSLAVQKQLGVGEPDFGFLTSDMQLSDQGVLPAGDLIQGRAEGEVAFFLARDLTMSDPTFEDVVRATDSVSVCIEIIDSRVAEWKIQIQDTVADNASSSHFVLGAKKVKLQGLDLRMAGMKLTRNGEVESTGVGAACLGNPVSAMQWLARRMAGLGDPLRAGDLILSGAYGPVIPLRAPLEGERGDRIEVAISGLGEVGFSFGEPSGVRPARKG